MRRPIRGPEGQVDDCAVWTSSDTATFDARHRQEARQAAANLVKSPQTHKVQFNSDNVCYVARSLLRFDDWLNRALEECARNAGEDVETYVARAVATQMTADQRRDETISIKELLAHLAESGVLDADAMPDVMGVIGDPDRLKALEATGLLDSPPEAIYDRITRAAADALDAPFSALTLIDADRQYFKSAVGMGDMSDPQKRQTPLDLSICQYAVADRNPLVLEDARSDPVFMKHPVVRSGGVVAYIGIPLTNHDGHAIGTLCVFDSKPRQWGTGHIQVLTDLAQLATERIFGPRPGTAPRR